MKIFVKARPNSKNEKIGQIDETHFSVSVTAPAQEGKANEAILKALAGHFNVPVSRVRIVSGHKTRNKIVEIF